MFNNTIKLSLLPLSWKSLITGFIVTLALGYLAAVMNAILAVGLSYGAIADHYGDSSLNPAEQSMLGEQGFIEEEFSLEDDGQVQDHLGHGGATMVDDSLTAQMLAQLSHVHLLGFSLILITIGGLTCLTQLTEKIKILLVGGLCLSFITDIAGLSLTRFVADGFAWLTLIAGTLIGVLLAIMMLRILWELWIAKEVY